MMIKQYLIEVLEPTLLFSLLNSMIGIAAAVYYHALASFILAAFVVVGVVLAQIGVNLIDDYVDYRSGLDREATRTKFSGGSELVVSGKVKLNHVLIIGTVAIVTAGTIGLYLISINSYILSLVFIGAVSMLFYARYLVKIPFLAEPLVALNFAMIGLGSFIVSTGSIAHSFNMIFAALPGGMLVASTLVVHEVPDMRVDKKFGRRSGVVMLKSPKNAAIFYLLIQGLIYLLIASGMLLNALPIGFAITFITMPLTIYVFFALRGYKSPASFEPRMAVNVINALVFTLLLSIAYIL